MKIEVWRMRPAVHAAIVVRLVVYRWQQSFKD